MTESNPSARRKSHRLGVLLIFISAISWASAGLFVRLLPFDVWSIIVWRGVFGTLFVGAFVIWQFRGKLISAIHDLGFAGAIVTACSTAIIFLFPAAFQHASVANVVIIYAALPFVTAAISWILLREKPSKPTLLASALAMLGIAIMVGPAAPGQYLGNILSFLTTIVMALLTITIRRNSHIQMLPVAFLSIFLSIFIALPFAGQLQDFAARDLLAAAGFGFFPITLGLMLYVMGSSRIPATLSALIGTIEAPAGVFWAWIGVGEIPAREAVFGGLIVLAGVFGRLFYDWRVEQKGS